ncbi:MAG: 4-hydroxy-tetrahydrodipicolinate reductase, partial [Desulfonatronovibrio sp.]
MDKKIVVTGVNGRMGRTIAGLVQEDSSLELAGVVERTDKLKDLERYDCPFGSDLSEIISRVGRCVIIDFTSPESSLDFAAECARKGNAAVMGTTGFTAEQLKKLEKFAEEAPIFWAPNMSVGINVLLRLLPDLAGLLGGKYDLELMEIHHKFKKDAPSGTALMLARVLAEARGIDLEEQGVFSRKGIIGQRKDHEMGVQTLRGGDVVGDHTVYFLG